MQLDESYASLMKKWQNGGAEGNDMRKYSLNLETTFVGSLTLV